MLFIYAALMVVTSLIGSALLMSVSVLGEYVGKIYEQVKGRPLYLVARTFNVEEPNRQDAPARSSNHAQR
jgi:dolichol-phosphate mannosyltransferase